MNMIAKDSTQKIFIYFVFFAVYFLLFAGFFYNVAMAANITGQNVSGSCPPGQLCNPVGTATLSGLVDKITTAAIRIGVPIAALFIIWAGFKFVTARGDVKAIDEAKSIFWWTLIGTAVLLAAKLLSTTLSETVTQVIG